MNYASMDILTVAYVISNVVGALILWTAINNTKIARFLFAVLFMWASWTNISTARVNPEVYLEYSKESIAVYSSFINGWFATHISVFVTVIAIGQCLIGLGMLMYARWVTIAGIGSILFLTSIAPLGLYAAFPFSISVSIAAWLIIRNDDKKPLWSSGKKIHKFY